MHLFVYGTLKDPRQLAAAVGPNVHSRVIDRGTVFGVLYDAGEYPVLRPSASAADLVEGLLLELDDAALASLDAYEGVESGLYVRQRCAVRTDDGSIQSAWLYVFNQSTTGLRRIASWPPDRG